MTGIVAHTYPEWWLKLTGQVAHWSTDYSILETVLIKGETILIASNLYPRELVKSKFLKLDFTHIEYAIGCFKSNTTKVNNIKKYLLATLFNAPSTIDGYYQAEVNHDFPQYASSRY